MSKETQRNEMAAKTVVHQVPGMEAVVVHKDVVYRDAEANPLTMDIYAPPGSTGGESKGGERRPAVIFVSGYPDPGFESVFGCKLKESGQYTSWGRLLAASGLVAITYTNRDPVADLDALLRHVRQNAASLGIDEGRLGVWAGSGNVPRALAALMEGASGPFRAAVLCYGLMLDAGEPATVAQAAAQFGFANPCGGRSIDDVPLDLPLFIARAGQDRMPHLNETIDRFVAGALARNLPITVVNHPTGPHAFDLLDESEASREVVRRMVEFLRFHLLA
ncbi:alpha/beta hydrolase [Sorangium sp. So ce385]|uniref:alpha/beta hydrolase n=1 Tax=Sorangium sp. So ce385 TaxID=3133308 RepID=UPI003F5B79CA